MTDTSLSSRALAFVVAIMSEKLTLWLIIPILGDADSSELGHREGNGQKSFFDFH
jgi:hypothetical protein